MRWRWPIGISVASLAVSALAGSSSVAASNVTINPPANIPSPTLLVSPATCTLPPGATSLADLRCASPCLPRPVVVYNDSPRCPALVVQGIDRERRAEHLRPLALPTNFASLGAGDQLFVLVNLERIARGVPPLVGVAEALSPAANSAAERGGDPIFAKRYGAIEVATDSGGTYAFDGAWAGGSLNPVAAIFGWLYQDGWGGPGKTSNLACTSSAASGCWAHRDELLGRDTGTTCSDCVAGVGYAGTARDGVRRSYAILIVRPAAASGPLAFSWNAQVLAHLSAYERVRASV
ncbi:MAG: hypothetical protein M0014_02730 [Actinomycetota bacterium]|nr:hypothetical protein [Actinomycetota bacterium]